MTWLDTLPFFVTPVGGILIGLSVLWMTERDARKRTPPKTPAE